MKIKVFLMERICSQQLRRTKTDNTIFRLIHRMADNLKKRRKKFFQYTYTNDEKRIKSDGLLGNSRKVFIKRLVIKKRRMGNEEE